MNRRIYNKIVGSICPNYNLTIRIKILKALIYLRSLSYE
jgi:hypothetical protein